MESTKSIFGVGTKLQVCVVLALVSMFAGKASALGFEQFVDDEYTLALYHFDDADQYYSSKWRYMDDNSNTGRPYKDLYLAVGEVSSGVAGVFGQACRFEPTVGTTESIYTRTGSANGRTGVATNIVWADKKSFVIDAHIWVDPTDTWGANDASFIMKIKNTTELRVFKKAANLVDLKFTVLDRSTPLVAYTLTLPDVTTGAWHRVRAFYNRGILEMTCDDVTVSMAGPAQMSSNSTATPGITASQIMQLGYDAANRYYCGKLDEVKISWLPDCGDWGYLPSDLTEDCVVDIADFAAMASNWLETN